MSAGFSKDDQSVRDNLISEINQKRIIGTNRLEKCARFDFPSYALKAFLHIMTFR